MRSLRRGTKHREASAWAGLGYAALYGAGLPQSDERAAKSLWLAAKMGHLDSIYNMGVLTLKGKGVPLSVANGVGPPSIDVRASIVRQAIEVLSENGTARLEAVEFGRVYCGLTRTRRVLLSNAGPTTVNWRVNRLLAGADSGGDDGTPSAPPPPPPPPPPAPPAPPPPPPWRRR